MPPRAGVSRAANLPYPLRRLALADADDRRALLALFDHTRAVTLDLVHGLEPEDLVVQAMPDASPAKWHLGHTSWFFETFLLLPRLPAWRPFHPLFGRLFNSYYDTIGDRIARDRRGLLCRPALGHVVDYRHHVDAGIRCLAATLDDQAWPAVAPLLALGIAHEEQHQELILTDLLALFAINPLQPAYRPLAPAASPPAVTTPAAPSGREPAPRITWITQEAGLHRIGHDRSGFAYDIETPAHRVALEAHRLADRPVTNGQWMAFINDGGYGRPTLWMDDGWRRVRTEGWGAPLYWQSDDDGGWWSMTLRGLVPVDPMAPVVHVSWFEADAFARWAGRRLPREGEWEAAARTVPPVGNTLGSGLLRPIPAPVEQPDVRPTEPRPLQMYGDVWEWTASPFTAYPGYRQPAGALGEYNGKFLSGRMVLRGGSCLTPDGHIRATYRNFLEPHQRWQASGLRLAEDA